jgi:hypothetical protein
MNRSAMILMTALLMNAAPTFAGEITRENASADFEWKSAECPRPIRPRPQRGLLRSFETRPPSSLGSLQRGFWLPRSGCSRRPV